MNEIIFDFKSMIIGNRGCKGDIMENTLESILYAIKQGADGITIDVRKTLTGELVLFHDKTLNRLAFKDDFFFANSNNKEIEKLQWYHLFNTNLIDSIGRNYKIPQLIDILRNEKVWQSDILIMIYLHDDCYDCTRIIAELIEEGLYEPSRFLLSSSSVEILNYLYEFKKELLEKDKNYEKLKIGQIISSNTKDNKNSQTVRKLHSKVVTHLIFETLELFENFPIYNNKIKTFVYFNNLSGLENLVDGIITDKISNFK